MALLPLLCTRTDMEQFASVQAVTLRADDLQLGAPNQLGIARIDQARVMGTSTCLYYLYAKYSLSNLADRTSFGGALVNQWATFLSLYQLCTSRFNPAPDSLIENCLDAEKKMKDIYDGRHFLPMTPLRRQQAPVWDNTRLNICNNFRVIRVETNRSSQQPNNIPVSIDYGDYFWGSFEL